MALTSLARWAMRTLEVKQRRKSKSADNRGMWSGTPSSTADAYNLHPIAVNNALRATV